MEEREGIDPSGFFSSRLFPHQQLGDNGEGKGEGKEKEEFDEGHTDGHVHRIRYSRRFRIFNFDFQFRFLRIFNFDFQLRFLKIFKSFPSQLFSFQPWSEVNDPMWEDMWYLNRLPSSSSSPTSSSSLSLSPSSLSPSPSPLSS